MGLAGPGGPCFSHPLTTPGVGAAGLALVLNPETLAQVPCFLTVASAGQYCSVFVQFSVGAVPSVSSPERYPGFQKPLVFYQSPQLSEPVTLVLMLAQERAHTQLFSLGVCAFVCLFKFVLKYFLHVVPSSGPSDFVRIFVASGREWKSTVLAECHCSSWSLRPS